MNFRVMREIADEVDATLMVDMAHFAGLVAGKVFVGDFDPVPHAHIVTSTTHKTLRGPRGGLVLCERDLAEFVDRGCPLVLGGRLPHVMAAKAVALAEASQPSFDDYAAAVVDNARMLAEQLARRGISVVTGGTDNHLVLVDVRPFGLNGRQAESALRADEMREIGDVIATALHATSAGVVASGPNRGRPSLVNFRLDDAVAEAAHSRVADLLARHPLYPEIDL